MVLSSINISAFVLRYCRNLGEAGETVRKVGGKDKECDNQRVELAVALLERLSPGLTQRDEPLHSTLLHFTTIIQSASFYAPRDQHSATTHPLSTFNHQLIHSK